MISQTFLFQLSNLSSRLATAADKTLVSDLHPGIPMQPSLKLLQYQSLLTLSLRGENHDKGFPEDADVKASRGGRHPFKFSSR